MPRLYDYSPFRSHIRFVGIWQTTFAVSPSDDSPDFLALRVEIAGTWSALDMATMLGDFARLYWIRTALDVEPRALRYRRRFLGPFDPWWLEQTRGWLPREGAGALDVLRIRHESPGFVDLAGIGKVVEQLRLFVQYLIDLPGERETKRIENEGKKIENAQKLVQLSVEAREAGLTDDDLRYLLYEVDDTQARLLRLIERGSITAVGPAPSCRGSSSRALLTGPLKTRNSGLPFSIAAQLQKRRRPGGRRSALATRQALSVESSAGGGGLIRLSECGPCRAAAPRRTPCPTRSG
jgi:hypothetical protein